MDRQLLDMTEYARAVLGMPRTKTKINHFICEHPDGTYSIGKGKFMLTNFSKKQLISLKSEIEAILAQEMQDE